MKELGLTQDLMSEIVYALQLKKERAISSTDMVVEQCCDALASPVETLRNCCCQGGRRGH